MSALRLAVLTALMVILAIPPALAQQSDEQLRRDLDRAEQEQRRLTGELDQAVDRLGVLEGQLGVVRDEAALASREVAALDAQTAAARRRFGAQIRERYKQAGTGDLLTLLSTEPADVGLRSHYLAVVSRHEQANLEVAAGLGRRLARRRADLRAADQRLDALTREADQVRADLDRRLSEAAGAEEGIRGEIARREADAKRLAEEAARARQAIEAARSVAERGRAEAAAAEASRRAQAAAATADQARRAQPAGQARRPVSSGGGAVVSGGGKACPQANPRSFTDTWGAPRSGGRTHQGTDIFGARGGPVYAITSGTITTAKTGGLSGLFMILRGDDGHSYWYIHLQDFVAGVGQRVAAGQLIAHNGDTGNARGTPPHIHFEYHPGGGGPVNPYPMLRGLCG